MASDIIAIGPGSIATAASLVRKGGLIVYPTDTVYGLGCDPFNEAAVTRLFEAKGRESKAVSVLCSSLAKAAELAELSPKALELARAHWPGALTMVCPAKMDLPRRLTQGSLKVGVRVPARQDCIELLDACGGWLTGTSANLSGKPSARDAMDAMKQMGESVDLILDGGHLAGPESTVVRVSGNEVAFLRTGPIGVGQQ
jgi:L-threonylcarbamoyladenylate synthase